MFRIFLLLLLVLETHCAGHRPPVSEGPQIRIAVKQQPLEVVEMPIEQYLRGVLASEVHDDWPLEALKAQAVASRTYAYFRKAHPRDASRYDIEATVADQVFSDEEDYPLPILLAVEETSGQILRYQGDLFPAFYHSHCGGISERAEEVWGGATIFPYTTHPDPFCEDSPTHRWKYEISPEEFGKIQILKRNETGRVSQVLIETKDGQEILSGDSFRKRIGYEKIRSTLFELEEKIGNWVFSGRGFGHGVGLCQWGARGMAEIGYTYEEILKFYYPGADLENAK